MKIKGEQPHQLHKIPKKPKKVQVSVENFNIYLVILICSELNILMIKTYAN